MSLNWNIRKIKDHEQLYVVGRAGPMGQFIPDPKGQEKRLCVMTETLIFSLMSIDIGEIKDSNVNEVYKRIRFLEQAHGAFRLEPDEKGELQKVSYTRKEIARHVGLSTNVETKSTSAWLSRQWKQWDPE